MKSRLVDKITSNEEYVRLRIFDGDIPIDEADKEMRRIELCQLRADNARLRACCDGLAECLRGRGVFGRLSAWRLRRRLIHG